MATIITVHGTGATGPEEGDQWWQKGSPFEKHIRQLVESDDGELTFQRVIWDGANSETSRRAAASELYEAARRLERESERYCVVGHSHGGSIAANALLLGAAKQNRLPGLTRWITIGTPFLKTAKTRLLFSRLSLLGKSAYISVMMMVLVVAILLLYEQSLESHELTLWLWVGLLFGLPVILLYLTALWINARHLYMYRSKTRSYANSHFSPIWFPLFHSNDEAIQALRSLQRVRVRLFRRDFAIPFFSFVSLFVLPLVLVLLAMSATFINYIFPHLLELVKHDHFIVKDGKLIGGGQHVLVNLELITLTPLYYFANIVGMASSYFMFIVLFPMLSLMLSIVVTYISRVTAGVVSRFLSAILNRLTGRQIKMLAFGSDTEGEIPVDAHPQPPWTLLSIRPLPESLSSEITNLSNDAAAQAVAKFRRALDGIALRDSDDVKESLLSEYLTWEELIHCCYFYVARFRMLVGYAIANSEGFRPSEAFKSHPDYDLVAGWYEEIKPKAEPARV